jgi:hypothetical protein
MLLACGAPTGHANIHHGAHVETLSRIPPLSPAHALLDSTSTFARLVRLVSIVHCPQFFRSTMARVLGSVMAAPYCP